MTLTEIKGYELNVISIRDSHNRRAQKFKNNIISKLRSIGLKEDDIDVPLEVVAMKSAPASASWYVEGSHLHYSHKTCSKFVENLYVVSKIIEFEVKALLSGEKTINQFILDFMEEHDVEEERKEAREFLGIDADSLDLDLINKRYKLLAKDAHPDMPNGDTEKFKALNRAHKILKRELE